MRGSRLSRVIQMMTVSPAEIVRFDDRVSVGGDSWRRLAGLCLVASGAARLAFATGCFVDVVSADFFRMPASAWGEDLATAAAGDGLENSFLEGSV